MLLRFLFRTNVFNSVGGVLFSLNSDWQCGGKSFGVMIPGRGGCEDRQVYWGGYVGGVRVSPRCVYHDGCRLERGG